MMHSYIHICTLKYVSQCCNLAKCVHAQYVGCYRHSISLCFLSTARDDYSLDETQSINVLFTSNEFQNVDVGFILDGIAREPNETLNLTLNIQNRDPPEGVNFFFLKEKALTIVDSDSKCDSCSNQYNYSVFTAEEAC